MNVVQLPRAGVTVRCPYCRHETHAVCRIPNDHALVHECAACDGRYVVEFLVTIKADARAIEGERDFVEERQERLLDLQRHLAGDPA